MGAIQRPRRRNVKRSHSSHDARPNSIKALSRVRKLAFRVEGEKMVFDLQKELTTNAEDPTVLFEEHTGQVAFWRTLFANAKRRLRDARRSLEKIEADAIVAVRHELKEESDYVSNDEVRAWVTKYESYQRAREKVDAIQNEVDLIDGVLSAMAHRRSVLLDKCERSRKDRENPHG